MLGIPGGGPTETEKKCKADTMIDTMGCKRRKITAVAERVGFEPTVRFPVRSLSRRVLSTAQSPLRGRCKFNRSKGSVFRQRNSTTGFRRSSLHTFRSLRKRGANKARLPTRRFAD